MSIMLFTSTVQTFERKNQQSDCRQKVSHNRLLSFSGLFMAAAEWTAAPSSFSNCGPQFEPFCARFFIPPLGAKLDARATWGPKAKKAAAAIPPLSLYYGVVRLDGRLRSSRSLVRSRPPSQAAAATTSRIAVRRLHMECGVSSPRAGLKRPQPPSYPHPRSSTTTSPIARLFADDDDDDDADQPQPAPSPPLLTADQIADHAAEIASLLCQMGVKLVCIDFDATLVRVHTGGAWTHPARDLCAHVRPLFLALIPRLLAADVHVAVVTFSPQVPLIKEVLARSFSLEIAQRLILRGDDASWQLAHNETLGFAPLWQFGGRHLDRTCKLPFVISAALQASHERCESVCNRDTVLFDDDAANIRVVNDSGITGIYFEPAHQTNFAALMRQVRRFQLTSAVAAASTISGGSGGIVPSNPSVSSHQHPPMTPLRTPSKKQPTARMVRLMASPESRFITTSSSSNSSSSVQARHRGHGSGSGGGPMRTSRFHMCTPSPVMKLRSTVDMGRPRSKRSIRLIRNIENDLQELHLPSSSALTSSSSSSTSASSSGIGIGQQSQFKTTPMKLRMSLEMTTLPTAAPPTTTPLRRSRSRSPLQF